MDHSRHSKLSILLKKIIFCFGVCVILFGFILIYKYALNICFSTFNRQKWIENPEKRYIMVDDLMKNEILKGLTKEEVYGLLGKKNSIELSDKNICFSLGGDFHMNMLLITLNENNIVVEVSTYVD